MTLPTLTAGNFSTSGGSGVNYDIRVVYVGSGGATRSNAVTAFSVGLNGFVYTHPGDVPSYVAAIDIYARLTSATTGTYMWCGTMSRRANVFPATIACIIPVRAVSSGVVPEAVPNAFKAVPSATTGTIIGGRQYYCAVAPYVAQSSASNSAGGRNTRAYLAIATDFFAFTLPEINTSVDISFQWAASPAVAAGTNVTHWVLFIGPTPEDMLAVCDTVNGSILPIADATVRAGVNIKEIPYHSRNTIHMISSGEYNQGGVGLDALPGRDAGIFKNLSISTDPPTDDGGDVVFGPINPFGGGCPALGAWVIPSLPFDITTAYQLLPNINERNFIRENPYVAVVPANQAMPSAMTYYDPTDVAGLISEISATQYANRHYIANNYNVMFYTNGYSMKTAVRIDGGSYIPICQHIGLVNDTLALGGGSESFANTRNQVFYSEVANPNSFGISPVWNTFDVSSGDGSNINGFGLFSQDLSTVGGKTFLIISKGGAAEATFSWNGLGGDSLVVSFMDKTGFAGPKAFTQTRYGPVFISRHGAWLVNTGQTLSQIGDEVKTILESLSEENLRKVNVVYSGTQVKVGYTDTLGLDRELWIEIRQENGGPEKFWKGPHTLQAFTDQAAIGFFQNESNYRMSSYGANLYRRDIGTTNVGVDMSHKIVISRLGLNADHFRKLINWIYLSVEVAQDETFVFTLSQIDGSATHTFSGTALLAAGVEQFLQTRLVDRVVGRVYTLTIDTTSDSAISLFDISMLYEVQRRRKMG